MSAVNAAFRRALGKRLAAILVALVVNSLASFGDAYADSPASPPSSTAVTTCPSVLQLASSNGTDYAVVFGASAPLTASFVVQLYGAEGDYSATLPAVAIATPYVDFRQVRWFRSTAIDLQKTSDKELFAAGIRVEVDGTSCPDIDVFIQSVDVIRHGRAEIVIHGKLNTMIATEVGDGSKGVPMLPLATPAFPCKKPFTDARLVHARQPDYPDFSKQTGQTGSATIAVSLDAHGSVTAANPIFSSGFPLLDAATLEAARSSTYVPATFACAPTASQNYLFTATFSGW